MTMDVQREGVAETKRRRRIVYGCLAGVGVAIITLALSRLEPAAPSLNRAGVSLGTVKRGEMLRQVRGPGRLVSEEIRHVSATTEGTVERIGALPGQTVEHDTIILELSNPELEQSTRDSALAVAAAEAEYINLEVSLERELLSDQAAAGRAESDFRQADLEAQAYRRLFEEGLIADLQFQISKMRAEELKQRTEIEQRRFEIAAKSVEARLGAEKARLQRIRALSDLRRAQLADLQVKAGIGGVLQEVPVAVGESIPLGGTLAIVARPDKLKAEIRIPESQASDIVLNQTAFIDTRNGIVEGRVVRIDPAVRNGTVTIDVALSGQLPHGARPDLSVEATIEIERLSDVLYIARPAYVSGLSRSTLFRLAKDGRSVERVPVELGKSSVNTIEIIRGLDLGDEVLLNDIGQYKDHDRIRLK
jgi:HlyD family secretion protein